MGFFQKIVQGIKKTKDAFSKKLFFAFSARELDDEFYENLEEALLTADVGITATENLIEELKDEIFKRKIKKPFIFSHNKTECKSVRNINGKIIFYSRSVSLSPRS